MRLTVQLLTAFLFGGSSLLAGDTYEVTTPGKAGSGGSIPSLSGTGPLSPGSAINALTLTDALPNTTAGLVLGFTQLGAPFKGGVLGPAPNKVLFGFGPDGAGALSMPFAVPPELPAELEVFAQFWIVDPGVFAGLSASNTLKLTVQESPALHALFLGPTHRVGDEVPWLEVADLDGDGLADLCTTGRVLLATADGTFGPPLITGLSTAESFRLEDLNEDGILDLIAPQGTTSAVAVALGAGDGTFGPLEQHSVPALPFSVAVGDVDGDQIPDIVAACRSADGVAVLRGLGAGAFAAFQFHPTSPDPSSVELADLDGDGDLDVAAACRNPDVISTLRGTGDGSFGLPIDFPIAHDPRPLVVRDLNGDGVQDIVVPLTQADAVSVLLGVGDGTFATEQLHAVPAPRLVVIRDLDGDRTLDLIVANSGASILRGDGAGAFTPPEHIPVVSLTSALAVDDLHDDGTLDLVISTFTNSVSSKVSVFAGDGSGGFETAQRLNIGNNPGFVELIDVDGDDLLDLVATNANPVPQTGAVSVRRANGSGGFLAPQFSPVGSDPHSLTLGDLNGDGVPDAVLTRDPLFSTVNDRLITLLGNGNGTFGAPQFIPMKNPLGAVIADFDGDAISDLAVAVNSINKGLEVFHGLGDGTFTATSVINPGGRPVGIVSGDWNADGHMDLAMTLSSEDRVNILIGSGNGTFDVVLGPTLTSTPGAVTANDVNADGVLDLVVVVQTAGQAQVLQGNGDATFVATTALTVNASARAVRFADFDGDGVQDAAVSFSNPPGVAVFPGLGDGTFSEPASFTLHTAPSFAAGDIDQDGDVDLVSPVPSDDQLELLRNRLVEPR